MACSLSSFSNLNQAFCRPNKLFQYYPKVRSQGFRDNGKPGNNVDANMSVLRERIQKVRKMEEKSIKLRHTCGWNYERNYDSKYKGDFMVSQTTEIMGLACRLIALVFLTGSLTILFVSFLV